MSAFNLLGLDTTKNLSLFTVPAAFVLCMIPNIIAGASAGKLYDNANPRGFKDVIAKEESMDKQCKQRIMRAKAASENGFETLGFYAAAVVAANQAGLEASVINTLTMGYLASRVAYIFVYIQLQENRKFAGVRSLAWIGVQGFTFALYIQAGLKMMRGNVI